MQEADTNDREAALELALRQALSSRGKLNDVMAALIESVYAAEGVKLNEKRLKRLTQKAEPYLISEIAKAVASILAKEGKPRNEQRF